MQQDNCTQHLPLVNSIIFHHGISPTHKIFEDLQQEGLVAVYEGLKTYNKKLGAVSNHLYYLIRSRVQRYIAGNSLQVSFNTYETMCKRQHPELSLQKRHSRKETGNIGEFIDFCKVDCRTPADEIDLKEKEEFEERKEKKVMRIIKKLPRREQRLIRIFFWRRSFYTDYTKSQCRQLDAYLKSKHCKCGSTQRYNELKWQLINKIRRKIK